VCRIVVPFPYGSVARFRYASMACRPMFCVRSAWSVALGELKLQASVRIRAVSTDPRWLSAAETDAWVALVGVLIKVPAALDGELRRRVGLAHFEYLALSALSEAAGRTLPMSELASLSNASLSRLSHVIAKLEQRGWVTRAACTTNGRVTEATLTDAGFALVVEAAPVHLELARTYVFDALDPAQVGQLTAIARQILATVDPDAHYPPRGTAIRP
jgi:YD repeat-containing protein